MPPRRRTSGQGRRGGQEALDAFEAEAADLIVTDVIMPGMDGLAVIRALRKMVPGLPIVAMSGGGILPENWLLDEAEDLGTVESMPKPFDLNVLLRVVERALADSG